MCSRIVNGCHRRSGHEPERTWNGAGCHRAREEKDEDEEENEGDGSQQDEDVDLSCHIREGVSLASSLNVCLNAAHGSKYLQCVLNSDIISGIAAEAEHSLSKSSLPCPANEHALRCRKVGVASCALPLPPL